MTTHFTHEQLVDALDHPPQAERQSHLDTCPECATELATLRRLMDDVVAAGDVPEPSPLFWNHLSARVREAVDAEALPAASWWGGWRMLATVAGVVGVVVLAAVLRPSPRGRIVPADVPANAAETAASDETSAVWDMMASVAPSMAPETIDEAGWRPAPETTAAAIAALTNRQRQELMELLRAEMRGSGASE